MIQKLRIASLIGVHILILAHIYIFGDEVVGSVDFQEFFHAFLKSGIINSGVVLVIIAFLTTVIFGRFFCGWACHFGAIQELSWWILQKINITPKTVNSRLVTVLPLLVLLNFYVIPNFIYAINVPWEGIKLNFSQPEIWAFLPGFIIGLLTFLVDGFLIVYFLGRKGFCRFLCPWGAFLKLPNSLAMYKVRNIGGCQNSGNCTSDCPVGIDVNYEINNYSKVTSTNCTSCLICIGNCPSSALSYKWKNPLNENFDLKHYMLNREMFNLPIIKDKFQSLHTRDLFLFPLVIIFGFAIDGLYGMGHFLSFGIALILSSQILLLKDKIHNSMIRNIIIGLIFIFITWHGTIKFSIWRGLDYYEKNNFRSAIPHLERAIMIYPKTIGRFHLILGEMYLENGNKIRAEFYAKKALEINPDHEAPIRLLQKIKFYSK